MEIEPSNDSRIVTFAEGANDREPREGFVPHERKAAEVVTRSIAELREDYRRVVGDILAMTQDVPSDDGLHLEEIEVGLAFKASGELGFIAKASVGVEATVKLKFKR